jgi:hypothetical protein
MIKKDAFFSSTTIDNISHEVCFGLYDGYGSTAGECSMRWHELQIGCWSARIEMFEDAFHLLSEFADIFTVLAELAERNITEDTFVWLLKYHGFEDLTPYTAPRDQSSSK